MGGEKFVPIATQLALTLLTGTCHTLYNKDNNQQVRTGSRNNQDIYNNNTR